MLANIFLPEQIDSFYLFTRRIVAVEIASRHLYVTVLRAHRRKKTIEKFLEIGYDPQEPDSLLQAIARLLREVDPYDKMFIILPSGLVMYKTLTLPFISLEKIKLVVPFEIESSLPFALHEASIDIIINVLNKQENNAQVLAVAIKQTILEHTINPFITASIKPKKVTVGSVELYALIKQSGKISATGASAIIHFNHSSTTILIIIDGALKNVRVLTEGVSEEMKRIHFNTSQQIPPHIAKFFSSIQFTVQAALKNENVNRPLSQVIISGSATKIAEFPTYMENILGCPCTVFQLQNIVHNNNIAFESPASIAPEFTISLAAALEPKETEEFNIGRIYSSSEELKQFKYQVITTLTLFIGMMLCIIISGFFNIRSLKQEANLLTNQMVQELNQEFNLGIKKSTPKSLSSFLQSAEQKLISEESIWFALSSNRRFSYLKYLQTLGTTINRDELGLNMKRLAIKSDERTGEDTVSFEGSVPLENYRSLVLLEEGLYATQLFKEIPHLQDTKFNFSLVTFQNEKSSL